MKFFAIKSQGKHEHSVIFSWKYSQFLMRSTPSMISTKKKRSFHKKRNISVRVSVFKAWFKHVPSLKQNSCPEIETCKIYKHWWYSLTAVMQIRCNTYSLCDEICSSEKHRIEIPDEIGLQNCHYDTMGEIFTLYSFLFFCTCTMIYNYETFQRLRAV